MHSIIFYKEESGKLRPRGGEGRDRRRRQIGRLLMYTATESAERTALRIADIYLQIYERLR